MISRIANALHRKSEKRYASVVVHDSMTTIILFWKLSVPLIVPNTINLVKISKRDYPKEKRKQKQTNPTPSKCFLGALIIIDLAQQRYPHYTYYIITSYD